MREDHSEDRDRRLQNRGETRGNVKLGPEKQRVIYAEHQDAGPREEFEIPAAPRNQGHATNRNREENGDRNEKTNRYEGNRRKITKSELDREPGRTPDQTEGNKRGDRR